MDIKPVITKRYNGEYSTVVIGDIIETMWFGDDGSQVTVGRTSFRKSDIAQQHISKFEAE